jgi:hypothetical protein
MRNTTDVTGGKPVAVLLQSISGVRAINHLVAFTTSMEERERCYSFILSRTPHVTPDLNLKYNKNKHYNNKENIHYHRTFGIVFEWLYAHRWNCKRWLVNKLKRRGGIVFCVWGQRVLYLLCADCCNRAQTFTAPTVSGAPSTLNLIHFNLTKVPADGAEEGLISVARCQLTHAPINPITMVHR